MSIKEVNSSTFPEETSSGLVLVDFNADWCGPCQMFKPILDTLSEEIPEPILSVNIDESPELAEKYNVSGIPCLVLLKDGEEVARSIGVIPEKKIIKLIEKNRK
ncbi:thioredoxin [Candidatus Saccharibacteria bacterium]|nr:thioredoxin [Candidatus Saccharibacteria bacterium]